MVVESSLMATKFGKDDDVDVELELCLSLGGPFKKTKKSKQIESTTDGQLKGVRFSNDIGVNFDDGTKKHEINATSKKREANKQQRNREEGESKSLRTECIGVANSVDLDLSFRKMGNGYRSGQIRSPICTSSDVSELSSSSRQEGGSSDFGVNCGHTKTVKSIQTGTEESVQSTNGSQDAEVVKNHEWSNCVAREIRKAPKPLPNGNGIGGLLPFTQMPCVTSTGNGPNGKTVNGFLYRYSKSEISIMCICHGTSFSPAEFIVHAGGTNVSHPLRHITVVPSTF